jgi:hypothetical protein
VIGETKRYYDDKGIPHRLDGPAIERKDGAQYWFKHGYYHREDGPAICVSDNDYTWYLNGKYHRLDGPAIVHPQGYMCWFQFGRKHNAHGPAVYMELKNGKLHKEWWYEGTQYKNETDMLHKAKPSIEELSKMFREVCNE